MSTIRRYDYEIPLSDAAKKYLAGLIGDDLSPLLVSWTDPMSEDDSSRIVILSNRGNTMVESPGNSFLQLDVIVRTFWKQPSMNDDFTEHRRRQNIVFDKMMSPTLADDLMANIEAGIKIDFVQPRRDFETEIFGKDGGFIESKITTGVHCFSTEAA